MQIINNITRLLIRFFLSVCVEGGVCDEHPNTKNIYLETIFANILFSCKILSLLNNKALDQNRRDKKINLVFYKICYTEQLYKV